MSPPSISTAQPYHDYRPLPQAKAPHSATAAGSNLLAQAIHAQLAPCAAELLELTGWLMCCKHLWHAMPAPSHYQPAVPFSLRNPFQSFCTAPQAVARAVERIVGTEDQGLAQQIIAHVEANYATNYHLEEQRIAACTDAQLRTGIDATDAPQNWPPDYLALALQTFDLRGADLRELDLRNFNLNLIYFEEVDLSAANLSGSNLDDSTFKRCKMHSCDLGGASLRNVTFYDCDLTLAELSDADLSGASLKYNRMAQSALCATQLRYATLHALDFSDADMHLADLLGSTIAQGNFSNARMMECNLTDAFMRECNMESAIMTGSILERTIMLRCNLRDAQLEEADLFEADLRGANLAGTGFFAANLVDARIDPENLLKPELRDATLSGLKLAAAPEGIALDSELLLMRNALHPTIDHLVRRTLKRDFEAYDSEPDGAYLDSESDSDTEYDPIVIEPSVPNETRAHYEERYKEDFVSGYVDGRFKRSRGNPVTGGYADGHYDGQYDGRSARDKVNSRAGPKINATPRNGALWKHLLCLYLFTLDSPSRLLRAFTRSVSEPEVGPEFPGSGPSTHRAKARLAIRSRKAGNAVLKEQQNAWAANQPALPWTQQSAKSPTS